MFYLYVDLCVLADVDIVASAINASTAIRLLYVNTEEDVQAAWSSLPGGSVRMVSMLVLLEDFDWSG